MLVLTFSFLLLESVLLSGKFEFYEVRGGRKDGRTSRESDALLNLPPPSANVQLLVQSFSRKGLSLETWSLSQDTGHLKEFFTVHHFLGRHINFSKTGMLDPTMDFHSVQKLKRQLYLCRPKKRQLLKTDLPQPG